MKFSYSLFPVVFLTQQIIAAPATETQLIFSRPFEIGSSVHLSRGFSVSERGGRLLEIPPPTCLGKDQIDCSAQTTCVWKRKWYQFNGKCQEKTVHSKTIPSDNICKGFGRHQCETTENCNWQTKFYFFSKCTKQQKD